MGKTVRMISESGLITACAIDATDIVARAQEIHHTSPTASAAIGRALAIASLMGGMTKVEGGSVTLQFIGNGPGGRVFAIGESDGSVRGYVGDPNCDPPRREDGKLDVGAFVGFDGHLTVIKDLHMNEPYVGTVALLGGEIAEDVASYYAESEQIPSAVAAGVLIAPDRSIAAAGAYIIQLLPGATEETAEQLEAAVIKAGPVTEQLQKGLTPEEMLNNLLEGFDPVVLDRYDAKYRCGCTRNRVERALISTGEENLREMIKEGNETEITCQFCDSVYRFTPAQLTELLNKSLKN